MSDYTTAALIKERAGISGTADDTPLGVIATAVSRAIDDYCGRTIYTSSATARTFDALGPAVQDETFYLDDDLASITSVVVDSVSFSNSTDYVTLPRNITPYYALKMRRDSTRHWLDVSTAQEEDAIVITGLWCMVPDTDDGRYKTVAEAAIQWAIHLYRLKDAGAQDVVAITDGGLMSVPRGMPATVRQMLDPFRKPTGVTIA